MSPLKGKAFGAVAGFQTTVSSYYITVNILKNRLSKSKSITFPLCDKLKSLAQATEYDDLKH